MKLRVVMYGEHGGELDVAGVDHFTEEKALRDAKAALLIMIRDATLSVGDYFKIEEVR